MKIELFHTNSLVIREENFEKVKCLSTFNTSDVHYDSKYFNDKLFRRHMNEAQERKSFVFIYGDFFDAMQGKHDKRHTREELLDKYNVDDYFMAIVLDALEYLSQWKVYYFMARGNHETAAKRHTMVDMISWMEVLGRARGMKIRALPYAGFIRWQLSQYANGGVRHSFLNYYHHGKGGSAPVTRGVIQAQRQAANNPDNDIVFNGHNHEAYVVPVPRRRYNFALNKPYVDYQNHVRTPGYKMDSLVCGATDGFDIEKGDPKVNGGVFVDYIYEGGEYYYRTDERISGYDA